MDLVHDRGSMDPVQRGGPWTLGPCFVLTHANADAAHISSLAYLWDSPSQIRWCFCGLVSVIHMAYDPRQNSLFEFWIYHLNFYLNFIAKYKILHSSFRFRIIGKRFTLVFYFLNSTLKFDLVRRIFSTRFIKLHLPSHISNSTLKIFNTTSEFSFTLQWSLIKTILGGGGELVVGGSLVL